MGQDGPTQRREIEPAPFAWEDVALRRRLPEALRSLLGSPSSIVVVPANVRDRIAARHPTDVAALAREDDMLAEWEYAGLSPKREARLETYARRGDVWMTVVVQHDRVTGTNVLATLRRIYARKKVESHARRSYLRHTDEW